MGKARVNFFGGIIEATGGEKKIEVEVSNVKELLDDLVSTYGKAFKERILESDGQPKRFINIFINNKDIRFLKNLNTEIKDGDEILIVPAVGGG
ncbi:MAG: MoaD family protein [Candidatus Bathyarchaeia archaeon]